jgi:predicted P-loop ATPase
MLRMTMLVNPLPGKDRDGLPRPARDCDVTATQEWLQLAGLATIGKDVTHQAVDARAMEKAYHPVKDYLNGLTWDGTPRVDRWLHTYMGSEDNHYTRAIGKMFLISTVARIDQPGCKVDHMLILEGPQGSMKSRACRIIGGPWYSDGLPDVRTGGKDLSQHLNGKWLIEIGEMSAFSKADAEALKTFVTRQEERYRPPYGRKEVIEQRQCVFICTTNKATYLRDETGGRRSWPAVCGVIDIDGLARDRDQLFAEAVHRYRQGEQWWPDREFERQHIQPEQDARYEPDVWEDDISAYLIGKTETTISEVAHLAVFLETPKISRADQNRIAAALKRLGWAQGKRTTNKRPWVRSA